MLKSISDFDAKNIENIVKNWISEQDLPMGKIMQPLRVKIVGAMKGPDLFEIIAMIGKEEAIKRIINVTM